MVYSTVNGGLQSKRNVMAVVNVVTLLAILNLSLVCCVNAANNLPALTDLSSFPSSAGVVFFGDTDSATGLGNSPAGDFNGDGVQDFIITSPVTNPNGRAGAGEAFVIFGSASLPSSINLPTLTASQGVRIIGANASDGDSDIFVSYAGDFNKDGFGDVVIGFPGGSPYGRTNAGYSAIIFGGKTLPATVDLLTLTPSQGIFIAGGNVNDETGSTVSGVGDVDGNGFQDVVISTLNVLTPGSVYLLLGSATFPSVIDLAQCTTTFAAYCKFIKGTSIGGSFGEVASSAGDINGDGIADFMIGAPENPSSFGQVEAGQLFVFYGRTTFPAVIDLSTTTNFGGIVIQGSNSFELLAIDATLAGDMNQDGFDDILVSNQNNLAPDPDNTTTFYLIYGGSSLPQISNISGYPSAITFLGANGFNSLSGNYDINQDGTKDFLIGKPFVTVNGVSDSGEVYLIYGKQQFGSNVVDSSQTGSSRYRRVTNTQPDENGLPVNFVGDVNGDGAVDFIFGAPDADGDNGRLYLIYGIPNPSLTPSSTLSTSPSISMKSDSPRQRATKTPSKPPRRTRKRSKPRTSPTPQKSENSAAFSIVSSSLCLLFSLLLMSHL